MRKRNDKAKNGEEAIDKYSNFRDDDDEMKGREPGFPWSMLVRAIVLLVAGCGMLVFAFYVGKQQSLPKKITSINIEHISQTPSPKKPNISPPPQATNSQWPYVIPDDVDNDPTPLGKLFTEQELSKYNDEDSSLPVYISILGRVYDVSGGKFYRKAAGGYHFFTGKDASRAFVTGEFSGEAHKEDLKGLNPAQILSVREWQDFYDKHESYGYVGKLIGSYYDENGKATQYLKHIEKRVKQALEEKGKDEEERKIWPACNSRWSEKEGGWVWCSNDSGGIQRDWEGFPRKRFLPGKTDPRCVCAPSSKLGDPTLKLYDNCEVNQKECRSI